MGCQLQGGIGDSWPPQFVDVESWVHKQIQPPPIKPKLTPGRKYFLPVCYIHNLVRLSRFFHMQNSKIYNLALPPSQLPFAKAATLTHSPLPTGNIFTDGRRKWHMRTNLDCSKTYNIVGLKQLKSYQNRVKKASRATLRNDSLSTERALSKTSSDIKKSNKELLSKEEVYERVPRIQKEQVKPTGLKKRVKRKRGSWMTFTTDLEHPPLTQQRRLEGTGGAQFSLNRVKKRMDEHRQEWSRRHYQEGRFPDIYRSIELHRLKVEQNGNGKPNEDLVVTRSNHWGETLRTEKDMKDICFKRDLTRTIHDQNSFLTRGHSKIEAEREWLERKEDAGFRFKLHPAVCPDELKKTVLFR